MKSLISFVRSSQAPIQIIFGGRVPSGHEQLQQLIRHAERQSFRVWAFNRWQRVKARLGLCRV